MVLLENEDINKAIQCLEESSYTRAELEAYDKVQDAIRTHLTYIYDAETKGRREGFAAGKAEGEKERQELLAQIAQLEKLLHKS